MLPDYERKVHRILYNYISQRGRTPTIRELEIKTGQSANRIKEALLLLETEEFILWEDKSTLENIILLKEWEDESNRPRTYTSPHGTIDYWTEY